jgi:CelD/BcsL family acetyltransferase involved in cellulose biosynthesis
MVERIPIDALGAFEALRAQWDELYEADAHSQLFLSYPWLRAFLQNTPFHWSILTLREGDQLVAALPISLRGAPHYKVPIARELTYASAPFADYQGMLCRPGREDAAVAAFAQQLLALSWQRADFPDTADPRIGALVAALGSAGAKTRQSQGSPCSGIELPATFPEFLAQLSRTTRRGLVHPLNALTERLPEGRITSSDEGEVDVHIDAMLLVNKLRWGASPERMARYGALLRAAHAQGCLRVGIVWDGARPIAGNANFIDPVHKTTALYLVGHDPEYGRVSPGKALLAALIRDSIAAGYCMLDFLRGDDSYKASFTNRSSFNTHYAVARRGARALLLRAVEPAFASLRAALTRLRRQRAA